jgi:predicted RNase H-like HicB family nuclease
LDLPALWPSAIGDTIEECERGMREAVAFHLDGLREDGERERVPSQRRSPRLSSKSARRAAILARFP